MAIPVEIEHAIAAEIAGKEDRITVHELPSSMPGFVAVCNECEPDDPGSPGYLSGPLATSNELTVEAAKAVAADCVTHVTAESTHSILLYVHTPYER